MITVERKGILDRYKLKPAQVLVLGFASMILIGTILLSLPIASKEGESIGLLNALFTATSAVCVTGLVVVDTGTYWTAFGKTIILILIQTGGLGFMTMTTLIALVLGKRISLKERLIMQEALNQFNISGVVRLTQYVLITTFTIEGLGAIFLSLRFVPLYGFKKGVLYSIFHSISAFCNAGFDLIGNFRSLTPFVNDTLINIVIWALIIIGGLGFTVIIEIISFKKTARFSLHTKVVITLTIILILGSFLIIFALEYNNPNTLKDLPLNDKFIASMFQAITPRTAGFNTLPLDKMANASIFLIIILMFIGGSPNSTAGGTKTTTIGVLILSIFSIIRGKEDTEVFDRRISKDIVNRALAVVGIGMLWVMVVTMILSITEPDYTFLEVFFEAVSAFGTVGLSLGITPSLSILGKIVISLTMFAGRVGPMTLVLALARQQQKNSGKIKLPEDKILVG